MLHFNTSKLSGAPSEQQKSVKILQYANKFTENVSQLLKLSKLDKQFSTQEFPDKR